MKASSFRENKPHGEMLKCFTEGRIYVHELERRIGQNIIVKTASILFNCLFYVTTCIKSKICCSETVHIISVGNRNCSLMLEQEGIVKIFIIWWWYRIQGGLITDKVITFKYSEKRILG
jgi:hypothetical protein